MRSWAAPDPSFGGLLFTLSCGERLIAANYCLHSARVIHGVLMAHDSEFDAYSPGLQLMRHLLEWAADNAYQSVDFGIGDQLYKRQFGTHQGWAGTPSFASFARASQYAIRGQMEKIPNPWIASLPGRAMRRLDVYRGLSTAGAPRRSARLTTVEQARC